MNDLYKALHYVNRSYIRRTSLTPYNVPVKSFGLIDTKPDFIEGKKFEHIVLTIKSRRTGKEARILDTWPVEIENVSGIFTLVYRNKLLRKSERIFDRRTGVEYKAEPIARIKYSNNVIYRLIPIDKRG